MAPNSYIIPSLKAVLVHLLVIAVFTFNWESNSDRELIPKPQVVHAKVLTMADPIAARKDAKRKEEAVRKEAAAKKKAEAQKQLDAQKKADAKRQAEAKKKADAKKKTDAKKKAEAKKKDDLKRKAEEQKRAEKKHHKEAAERKQQEQLEREAAQRKKELAESLADELAQEQAAANALAVQSYKGLIRELVEQNWYVPLSARNGMKTVLRITLFPTGEVKSVAILKGSGDEAFDRSAVQAVRRAEKFEELQQLDPGVFDANFRSFNFEFNPQGLDR